MQNALNFTDFLFYNFCRIEYVKEFCQKFSHLKIKVYGQGWDSFIDPEASRGGLLDWNEVLVAYHQSRYSLCLHPLNCAQTPHESIIKCLASGGLPFYLNAIESVKHASISFAEDSTALKFGNLGTN